MNKTQFVLQLRQKISRRTALQSLSALALAVMYGPAVGRELAETIADELAQLETRSGGRLGVAIVDIETGWYAGLRMSETFGMCSTFKLPLAAVILHETERGAMRLDQAVSFTEDDMVAYAPVTGIHLEEGSMTVGELAEATQKTSDNVAANLLLKLLDGPAGFTRRLQAFGDQLTRLDRYEPGMNFVPPGETRDTTNPLAMARLVARFFDGSILSPQSAGTLRSWMEDTQTGTRRIRAGLPRDWPAGDKTGTAIAEGMPNKYNDVAVVWPDGAHAFVVAAYYEADGTYDDIRAQDEKVLQYVGEIAKAAIVSASGQS